MIKAIETKYQGYRFRSRLEARWAVFFDTFGIKWEYEKEGFDLGAAGRYLPDFWFPEAELWVEVKGAESTADEVKKCEALASQSNRPVLLIVGTPGTHRFSFYCWECNDGGGGSMWFDIVQPGFNGAGEFRLLVAGHRRRTYHDGGWEPLPWVVPNNKDFSAVKVYPSIEAARSARFEFGERG